MKNITYNELAACQDYAKRVINFYKLCNNNKLPTNASDAELAIREYNNEYKPFQRLYGYSIRGYINIIVDCIGFMVES